MRISELLQRVRPSLSFEFYPPSDELGFGDLYRTVASLKRLSPTYVSVTSGAGGATQHHTLELVGRIQSDIGIESVAHVTCVGSTERRIGALLDRLRAWGVENVLALRGDPPAGAGRHGDPGTLAHASDLVRLIRQRWPACCVAAACYPEGHPDAENLERDIEHLKHKVDCGVDLLITQLFFNNADYFSFRDRAEHAGIGVPIIAGIMPIVSVRQIKRFTQMCGAAMPVGLMRKIEAVEDDAEAVRHIGMYHATQQCLDLIEQDVAGIHFYTLNRSTATRAIFQFIRSGDGGRLGSSGDRLEHLRVRRA